MSVWLMLLKGSLQDLYSIIGISSMFTWPLIHLDILQ